MDHTVSYWCRYILFYFPSFIHLITESCDYRACVQGRYSIYTKYVKKIFLWSLFCSLDCSHRRSKHSQTVIFSLFAAEIERSQPHHQRPPLLKPNSCIFITFSICSESRGWWAAMKIYTLHFLPYIDPLWALFVFPPLINKQVASALLQSLGLKSHFHYSVAYAFQAGAFYLEGKWLFCGTPDSHHRLLFRWFATLSLKSLT